MRRAVCCVDAVRATVGDPGLRLCCSSVPVSGPTAGAGLTGDQDPGPAIDTARGWLTTARPRDSLRGGLTPLPRKPHGREEQGDPFSHGDPSSSRRWNVRLLFRCVGLASFLSFLVCPQNYIFFPSLK